MGDAWLVCAWCGTQIAAPAELPVGATLADGRYQVLGIIGRGGFGITYEVGDTRLKRRVAVKELFPESAVRHGSMVLTPPQARAAFRSARDRFLREARVLARFTHPGIVRVYEVFEAHGTAYLVMERLGGRTLVDVLRARDAPFTEAEVVDVAARVAAALRPVHAAGVLHRDINPSNIMLTEHGRIVVIDFGLARDFDPGHTMGMTRMVTPGYAPLEQYRGEGRFGPTTDIYGLAASCYRLATGRVPVAAVERDAGGELPSPHRLNPAISKEVSDAILDGLELEPAHRPQDLDAFLARLGIRWLPDSPRSVLLGSVGAGPADLAVAMGLDGAEAETIAGLGPAHRAHPAAAPMFDPGPAIAAAPPPPPPPPVPSPGARAEAPAGEPRSHLATEIVAPRPTPAPVPAPSTTPFTRPDRYGGNGGNGDTDGFADGSFAGDGDVADPTADPTAGRTEVPAAARGRDLDGNVDRDLEATYVPTPAPAAPRDPDRTWTPGDHRGVDATRSPESPWGSGAADWQADTPDTPEFSDGPGALPSPPRAPRPRLVTVPLAVLAIAVGSAAPLLGVGLVVLVVLPVLATVGDGVARRRRAEAGFAAGRSDRMPSGVVVPSRFVRNVVTSVLRSSPIVGVSAVLIAGWYALDQTSLSPGILEVLLRIIGGGAVAALLLSAREGSSRFRTGLGIERLVERSAPGGRITERLVVSWLVIVIIVAAALWLTPDTFPLP